MTETKRAEARHRLHLVCAISHCNPAESRRCPTRDDRPPVHARSTGHARGFHRVSVSALVTTVTELSAIAAPASAGVRWPVAASGTPTTL